MELGPTGNPSITTVGMGRILYVSGGGRNLRRLYYTPQAITFGANRFTRTTAEPFLQSTGPTINITDWRSTAGRYYWTENIIKPYLYADVALNTGRAIKAELENPDKNIGTVIGGSVARVGLQYIPVTVGAVALGLVELPWLAVLTGVTLIGASIAEYSSPTAEPVPAYLQDPESYIRKQPFVRNSKYGNLLAQLVLGKVKESDISVEIKLELNNELGSKEGIAFMDDIHNKFKQE